MILAGSSLKMNLRALVMILLIVFLCTECSFCKNEKTFARSSRKPQNRLLSGTLNGEKQKDNKPPKTDVSESTQQKSEEPFLPPAKEPEGKLLPLQECLDTAFAGHPDLGIKKANVDQQRALLRQNWALYDPTVNFQIMNQAMNSPSYGSTSMTMPASTSTSATTAAMPASTSFMPGSSNNSSYAQGLFNVQQTIYDFNQRSEKVRSASENLLASVFQLKSSWVAKVEEINEAYCQVIYARWSVIIGQDGLAKAKENLRVAKGFYDAGAKSKIDVTQAEIEVGISEVNLAQQQNELRNAEIKLAKAVGVDYSVVKGRKLEEQILHGEKTVIPEPKDAVAEMEQSHPDLLNYKAQKKGSIALARALFNGRLPTLSAQAAFGILIVDLPYQNVWNYSITLTIPLFYDNTAIAYAQQQLAIAAQNEEQVKQQRLVLLQQINKSYSDIEGAKIREEASEKEVKSAILNFMLAYKRYKQGVSTIIELNQARDYLNKSRTHYISSIFDRKVAEAKLMQAIGRPAFPDNPKASEPMIPWQNLKDPNYK